MGLEMSAILTESLIAYENEELEGMEILRLFQRLIQDGTVWSLQGSYGRMAKRLIETGWLDSSGNILREPGE